jgi:hypothetical protein
VNGPYAAAVAVADMITHQHTSAHISTELGVGSGGVHVAAGQRALPQALPVGVIHLQLCKACTQVENFTSA